MLAACMGALLSAVGDRGGGGHGGSHGVRSCFQVTRDRDCGGRPKAAVRPNRSLSRHAAYDRSALPNRHSDLSTKVGGI